MIFKKTQEGLSPLAFHLPLTISTGSLVVGSTEELVVGSTEELVCSKVVGSILVLDSKLVCMAVGSMDRDRSSSL